MFVLTTPSVAQQLSEKSTISVITCGPGEELFTAFGHSAFRVFDPLQNIDKIYNYGTFDFNAPNFYYNFAKGKLIYQLSTTKFPYFLYAYKQENRWVKGQILNLNEAQKQAFFNFLETNAKPKNRNYKYDFFYDNCATKIEDVVKIALEDDATFSNTHLASTKTHRDLIADYTEENFKWGKFGIDLALGSVIDNKASYNDYKFLPDYIYKAFNNATVINNGKKQPLVKNEVVFNKVENKNKKSSILPSPLITFTFLSILIILITIVNYQKRKRSKWLDFSLYFITGIVGIIVLILWFATDHTATYKNFNFLWAFAPNCIIAFYLLKNKLPKWIKTYNMLLLLLIVVLAIVWLFNIQQFNTALIPLLIALCIRYFYITNIK